MGTCTQDGGYAVLTMGHYSTNCSCVFLRTLLANFHALTLSEDPITITVLEKTLSVLYFSNCFYTRTKLCYGIQLHDSSHMLVCVLHEKLEIMKHFSRLNGNHARFGCACSDTPSSGFF